MDTLLTRNYCITCFSRVSIRTRAVLTGKVQTQWTRGLRVCRDVDDIKQYLVCVERVGGSVMCSKAVFPL